MSSFILFQRSFSTTSIFESAKTPLRSIQGPPLPTASVALAASGFVVPACTVRAIFPPEPNPSPTLRTRTVLDKHQTHCVKSALVADEGGVFFDNLEKARATHNRQLGFFGNEKF